MDKDDDLPFEVGQLIEARSFERGYRSAWFRCEIKQISRKNGFLHHLLKYFDFPDEKERWTKLYQVHPTYRKKGEPKRQLMVRPQYPLLYVDSLMPDINSIREVVVVITGSWNVGDLVDWWKDDCYWSGKLTKLLDNGKAEMELPPSPVGEGLSYEVSFKDLRPSLDWSLEDGWRVPTSVVDRESRQCARLIYPVIQADGDGSGFQEPSIGITSDVHVEDQLPSAEIVGDLVGEDLSNSSCPLKLRTKEDNSLNSLGSDTIEGAVLGLHELANKIKWIKGLLGVKTPSIDVQHSWKFVEHRAPSMGR